MAPYVLHGQAVDHEPSSELPEFAVWRFGATNDIELPGFYLLRFSPDGRFLAARNRDNIVEIRDCNTRKLIAEIGGHESKIRWMDFSQDGKYLLTAGDRFENVKIWQVDTGKKASDIECNPLFARFSPGGDQIWVIDENENSSKSRLLKYDWPNAMFSSHVDLRAKTYFQGAISDSARFLVGLQATRRKVAIPKLFDLSNDSAVILEGPSDAPQQVIFSGDENWVAAIYPRKDTIRIWSLYDAANQKFELRGHRQTVKSISFSSDSRFLVSAGWDKRVYVWDLLTKEPIGSLIGHDEHVVASAFKPLSWQVATAANGLKDSTVIVWDLKKLVFSKMPDQIRDQDFESEWRGLGVSNPVTALAHLNNIHHSIDRLFHLVQKKLKQRMAISRAQIIHWIGELDAKTFHKREEAMQKLIAARGPADKILQEELDSPGSTERHYRIRQILKMPRSRPAINAAEMRRIHRGILLLELLSEQVGYSAQVVELLESLAQNHPHSNICLDASLTLDRIRKRKASQLQ